jgi:hypothetical protein
MFQIKVVENVQFFYSEHHAIWDDVEKYGAAIHARDNIRGCLYTLMLVNQSSTQKHTHASTHLSTHAQTKCIDIIPIAFPRSSGSTKAPQS